MLFRSFALLMFLSTAAASARHLQEAYPKLGVNSLKELSYEYDVTVDEDCNYHFNVEFSHNDDFPVGSAETCVPGVDADYDGLPMLAGRWFYEEYPAYIQEATDMNHLSLDYNPCGHPTGGFLTPHYDCHFYRVSPSYRAEEMICEVIPGTPACYPEQTSASGKAFFALEEATDTGTSETTTDPILANMPTGFTSNVADAVINMGMHAFDRAGAPLNPADWMTPSLIMVTHNSSIISWEPMLPFHFAKGNETRSFESGTIEYVEQSIDTLPYEYCASFDATTKITTVSLSGKSNVCQTEFDAAKKEYEATLVKSGASSTTASVVGLLATTITMMMMMA